MAARPTATCSAWTPNACAYTTWASRSTSTASAGWWWRRNGKLYGIGGDNDEMARLFSYDPARGGYEMLGMIDVNRRPYYAWQGYVFDAMAIGTDGTVYMGQAERKSKLYLFYPN